MPEDAQPRRPATARVRHLGITARTTGLVAASLLALLALLVTLGTREARREFDADTRSRLDVLGSVATMELAAGMPAQVPHPLDALVRSAAEATELRVAILDQSGKLLAESEPGPAPLDRTVACRSCHAGGDPPSSVPVILFNRGDGPRSTASRVSVLPNDVECGACHDPRQRALGLVLVETPMEREGLALRRLAGRWLAVGGLIAITITLVLTAVLRRELIGPILRLRKRMAAVGRGDPDPPGDADHPSHEIGDLQRGFESMVERLRSTQARVEQLLAMRTRQVHSLSAEMRELQLQLMRVERLATLGELTATVAHEVRNPLNALSLDLQLAQRRFATLPCRHDSRLRELLSEARGEVQRLDTVVERLLSSARHGDRRRPGLELGAVLRGIVHLLQPTSERRRVRLALEGSSEPLHVTADEGALWQLFINLVLNAVQASPRPGVVTVELSGQGDHCTVRVRDHGPGIAVGTLDQVFQPFFTTRPDGHGLGLSIARRIVRQHDGELHYEETPGGGATFVVTFPVEPPGGGRAC